MRPVDLQLDLDTYAGPFDLLCTVLLRRELTLTDVRLAEVAVAYVQQLAQQGDIAPDDASEFLLLLASLMEIKARELLASDDVLDIEEPGSLESQEEMLDALIRYATFRAASAWLGIRGSRPRTWRSAARPVIRRRRTYDGPSLDPALLQRSMNVLLAQPGVDVRHLVGRHASVQQLAGRMLQLLQQRRSFDFDETFSTMTRLDQAVAFVAMLELARSGRLTIRQEQPFSSISIEAAVAAAASESAESATHAADAAMDTIDHDDIDRHTEVSIA